jgi:hypothetical protein
MMYGAIGFEENGRVKRERKDINRAKADVRMIALKA